MNNDSSRDANGLTDVKQLGLFAAIASLSYVFWIVGAMEMVERLAFYGVKAVAALYATDAKSKGGLGITATEFGTILLVWAFVQSLVPIFTGGLSDRYGYKETIFASTVVKILGYLIMAFFPTYWGFFVGAIVLAAGTAIFKPGIQGTLVKATNRQNSSMAWGVFYQTVNIGGFIGPLVAGLLRKLAWRYVFLACAVIICFNFLLLLTYKEVGKEERLERARLHKEGKLKRQSLWIESLQELIKPHVWVYLAIFSGFWFMFNALFDVLPLLIRDWVDTSDIMKTLFPGGESQNSVINFFVITNEAGTEIQPEGMINANAGMIMITCFLFAGLSAKMRATTSMVVGTLLASGALFVSGYSTLGWVSLAAIVVFSAGEMLSSPKFLEFVGNFAPNDKKAMYLGFSQIPLAIGWTLEGYLGPAMYDWFASKDRLARDLLAERIRGGAVSLPDGSALQPYAEKVNVAADGFAEMARSQTETFVAAIPEGEAFDWLVTFTQQDPRVLTNLLHTPTVGMVWYIMGAVGIISAFGIWLYGRWILTLKDPTSGTDPAASE